MAKPDKKLLGVQDYGEEELEFFLNPFKHTGNHSDKVIVTFITIKTLVQDLIGWLLLEAGLVLHPLLDSFLWALTHKSIIQMLSFAIINKRVKINIRSLSLSNNKINNLLKHMHHWNAFNRKTFNKLFFLGNINSAERNLARLGMRTHGLGGLLVNWSKSLTMWTLFRK